MKVENILSGKKTYLGLIAIAVGEAFVSIEGMPEDFGQVLKMVGFVLAAIGRFFTKGE